MDPEDAAAVARFQALQLAQVEGGLAALLPESRDAVLKKHCAPCVHAVCICDHSNCQKIVVNCVIVCVLVCVLVCTVCAIACARRSPAAPTGGRANFDPQFETSALSRIIW